jgi:hypothetical protein
MATKTILQSLSPMSAWRGPPLPAAWNIKWPWIGSQAISLVAGWNDVTFTVTPAIPQLEPDPSYRADLRYARYFFPHTEVAYWWNAVTKSYQEAGVAYPGEPAVYFAKGLTFKIANEVAETVTIEGVK